VGAPFLKVLVYPPGVGLNFGVLVLEDGAGVWVGTFYCADTL